jgi:hypothetical protein
MWANFRQLSMVDSRVIRESLIRVSASLMIEDEII